MQKADSDWTPPIFFSIRHHGCLVSGRHRNLDLPVPVPIGGLLRQDELPGSAKLQLSADSARGHVRQLVLLLRVGGEHVMIILWGSVATQR